MNTTATHVVEGTDLPAYDHGFSAQSYLHLGHGNRIVVPDQHVAYLRHLATAATNLADLIDKARETKTFEPTELQHPGTWLPGDQVVDWDDDVWTRRADGNWAYTDRRGRIHVLWDDERVDECYASDVEPVTITRLVERTAS